MTAEHIASYAQGLGFRTALKGSSVTVTLSSALPLSLDLSVAKRGMGADEFSDAVLSFASALEEDALYALALKDRIGMDPSHISDLDLDDFVVIMESGQLEQTRRDVRDGISSAWRLASDAQSLANRSVAVPAA